MKLAWEEEGDQWEWEKEKREQWDECDQNT